MMRPFERPDMLHFEAAQGWAELGEFAEANEELEKLSPKRRTEESSTDQRLRRS